MLSVAHSILMTLYVILPALMLAAMLLRRPVRRGEGIHSSPAGMATAAIATSLLLGIAASLIYGLWLDGVVAPGQVMLTCYFVAGLLGILKLVDFFFDRLCRLCFATWYRSRRTANRVVYAQIARAILLFVIGLPYMIAAAGTYRPKIIAGDESAWQRLGAHHVEFSSSDGLKLSGLWTVAAARPADLAADSRWGQQTLIICPGLGGGEASNLELAKEFLDDGYNVLSFDFRAHGRSEGHIISFGDLERFDVLGAVHWARVNAPAASGRIVAVGIDTGAAALLAAAGDEGSDGQSIAALAVIGCYDRLDKTADAVADIYFLQPLRGLVEYVGLPLACVQTGCDLYDFSPADAADGIAPRPIFFVQGRRDRIVLFDRGQDLYDAASAPKSHLWLDGTDEDAASNPDVVSRIRQFLDVAVPML